MTEAEFYQLVAKSREYLTTQQEFLEAEFKLGSYERFDWNQLTGQLIFSDVGVCKVVADFQFVGTLSKKAGTWLWSWANRSLERKVKQDLLEVKRFGEAHGLPPILQDEWEADEVDGWDMTALAANLLQAAGAYRAPDANGHAFLILTSVAWAPVAA